MQIAYHKNFLKSTKGLSANLQLKLAYLIELLQRNPFHQKLHTKQLSGELNGLLSFRITRDWRVIFQFTEPGTIQLLRTTHRKDAYR